MITFVPALAFDARTRFLLASGAIVDPVISIGLAEVDALFSGVDEEACPLWAE